MNFLAAVSTSLIPEGGADSIVDQFSDTIADAWPILAVGVGVGILIKVVKRFT